MIHANSVESYAAIQPTLGDKQAQVLDYIKRYGPCTDREVREGLGRLAWADAVSPRITELVALGLVTQAAKRKCQYTGRAVRVVALA